MLVGSDGKGLRRLTTHPEDDSNPRWLPDGREVVFLSSRTGISQVWKIRIDGGEAQAVTNLPIDAGNLLVSPDGTHIAFSADVFVDTTPEQTKARLDEIAKRKSSGQVFDRLFFRHWNAWNDGRRSHLFVMPIAGGKPVDVMAGMDADWPSKPFGGPDQAAFTPDGRSIVFSTRDVGNIGGVVHGLRSLCRADRRLGPAPLPDRIQRGNRRYAGVFAGRETVGLSGHGAAGLRSGPPADSRSRLAGRSGPRGSREMGPQPLQYPLE